MQKFCQVSTLILSLLLLSVALLGQSQLTKDIVVNDAVQDRRIGELESRMDKTDQKLMALTQSQIEMTGSLKIFTGVGIGFGSALTILQALNLVKKK